MRRFRVYLLVLVALVLQMTVVCRIRISAAEPDLVFLIIVFVAIYFGKARALEVGLVAGLLEDALTFDIFGANIVAFSLTAIVVGGIHTKLFRDLKATQAATVFLASLSAMMIHLAYTSAFARHPSLSVAEYVTGIVVPTACYNAIIAVPLGTLFARFVNLDEPESIL